jgi:hypothetical protein
MGAGNLALILTAMLIYRGAGWPTADILFGIIVLLLIWARYLDIVRYQGTTADGEPASMAHLKRYALILVVVAAALWAVARSLGAGFAQ